MKTHVRMARPGLEALEPRTLLSFDSSVAGDAPTTESTSQLRMAAREPAVKLLPKPVVADVPPLPAPSASNALAESLSASLPAFLSRGQKLTAPAVLKLNNRTGVPISGTTTVTLLFSKDTIVDASDAEVNVVPVQLNLTFGTKKRIELKLPEVPQLADGSYYLLAQLQRAGAAPETIATTRVFDVASPIAELTVAPPVLSLGKGRKSLGRVATAAFEIANVGDGEARGVCAYTLYAQSLATGLRVPLTAACNVGLKLKAGWTSKVHAKFVTPEGLQPGTYKLVAELAPRAVATATAQSVSNTCLTTFQVA